jgi:hypothetical protein
LKSKSKTRVRTQKSFFLINFSSFLGLAVQVCFALHNICEERKDFPRTEWIQSDPEEVGRRNQERRTSDERANEAKAIRNALKNYFFSQQFQPWDEEINF